MHRLEIGFRKIQDSTIGRQPATLYPQQYHGHYYRFRRMLVPHIDTCFESSQCSSAILRYFDEDQIKMAYNFYWHFQKMGP